MRSGVALAAAVVTTILAASPAEACRRPAIAPPPGLDDRVAFIATIDSRGIDVLERHSEISVLLRVQQRLRGRTQDFVTVRTRAERADPDLGIEEVVIVSCGPTRPHFGTPLAEATMGSEVIVLGRQTGGRGVRVEDLAPIDSPRGRELLAEAARP